MGLRGTVVGCRGKLTTHGEISVSYYKRGFFIVYIESSIRFGDSSAIQRGCNAEGN